MKKELNSFVRFYALIVEHPECTIIKEECSSNMYNRTKKTIKIKRMDALSKEELNKIRPKLWRDYVIYETVQTSQFPSREDMVVANTDQLFTRLLSDLQHRNIRIRLMVGDNEYVATPKFMVDIRNVIERAIEFHMQAYAFNYMVGLIEEDSNVERGI